jgi:hypothetical protein
MTKVEVAAQLKLDIDLSIISNGIYILRYVSREGNVISKKFVKQ